MIYVKKILQGRAGRVWLETLDGEIWLGDPAHPNGLNGDHVAFHLGEGSYQLTLSILGPWCSNPAAMKGDTDGIE